MRTLEKLLRQDGFDPDSWKAKTAQKKSGQSGGTLRNLLEADGVVLPEPPKIPSTGLSSENERSSERRLNIPNKQQLMDDAWSRMADPSYPAPTGDPLAAAEGAASMFTGGLAWTATTGLSAEQTHKAMRKATGTPDQYRVKEIDEEAVARGMEDPRLLSLPPGLRRPIAEQLTPRKEVALTPEEMESKRQNFRDTMQQMFSYAPKTRKGQELTEIAVAPFEALHEASKVASKYWLNKAGIDDPVAESVLTDALEILAGGALFSGATRGRKAYVKSRNAKLTDSRIKKQQRAAQKYLDTLDEFGDPIEAVKKARFDIRSWVDGIVQRFKKDGEISPEAAQKINEMFGEEGKYKETDIEPLGDPDYERMMRSLEESRGKRQAPQKQSPTGLDSLRQSLGSDAELQAYINRFSSLHGPFDHVSEASVYRQAAQDYNRIVREFDALNDWIDKNPWVKDRGESPIEKAAEPKFMNPEVLDFYDGLFEEVDAFDEIFGKLEDFIEPETASKTEVDAPLTDPVQEMMPEGRVITIDGQPGKYRLYTDHEGEIYAKASSGDFEFGVPEAVLPADTKFFEEAATGSFTKNGTKYYYRESAEPGSQINAKSIAQTIAKVNGILGIQKDPDSVVFVDLRPENPEYLGVHHSLQNTVVKLSPAEMFKKYDTHSPAHVALHELGHYIHSAFPKLNNPAFRRALKKTKEYTDFVEDFKTNSRAARYTEGQLFNEFFAEVTADWLRRQKPISRILAPVVRKLAAAWKEIINTFDLKLFGRRSGAATDVSLERSKIAAILDIYAERVRRERSKTVDSGSPKGVDAPKVSETTASLKQDKTVSKDQPRMDLDTLEIVVGPILRNLSQMYDLSNVPDAELRIVRDRALGKLHRGLDVKEIIRSYTDDVKQLVSKYEEPVSPVPKSNAAPKKSEIESPGTAKPATVPEAPN